MRVRIRKTLRIKEGSGLVFCHSRAAGSNEQETADGSDRR
jgi:hypothetical protein